MYLLLLHKLFNICAVFINQNAKGNQTITSLNKSKCKRKIILTGTPIQNNLTELYALCDFVNPTCLGNFTTFNHAFIQPIEQSHQRYATPHEIYSGEQKSVELTRLINKYVLRRNQSILTQYLNNKTEYIMFIQLTSIQHQLYELITNNKKLKSMIQQKNYSFMLNIIQVLQQLTNSVHMFYNKLHTYDWLDRSEINTNYNTNTLNINDNCKLLFIQSLCQQVKQNNEKIVIVTNYTNILDQLEQLCTTNTWLYYRIDGTTHKDTRMELIQSFNSVHSKQFIFLLSIKTGGVGINLIGANRLVLYEPQWNPSVDLQAIARVWRDGQTKPVYVYRLIASNTIDEKILQRQLCKTEISNVIIDEQCMNERIFDNNELQQLIKYNHSIQCETYNILQRNQHKSYHSWLYHTIVNDVDDPYLKLINDANVKFIFSRSTNDASELVIENESIQSATIESTDDTEATLDITNEPISEPINTSLKTTVTHASINTSTYDDDNSLSDFIVSDSEDPYNMTPTKKVSNKSKSKRKQADPNHYLDPSITAVDSDEATMNDDNNDNIRTTNVEITAEQALADSLVSSDDEIKPTQLQTMQHKRLKKINIDC